MRCGAQLRTISVGPGTQSTCTKVCRIGRGAQLGVVGLRQALVIVVAVVVAAVTIAAASVVLLVVAVT